MHARSCKTALLLAGAVTLAGCVTGGSEPAAAPEWRVDAAELEGLTTAGLKARFGLPPTSPDYVSTARDAEGGRLTIINGLDLLRSGSSCPAGLHPVFETGPGLLRFEFLDGRLRRAVSIVGSGATEARAEIILRCRASRNPDEPEGPVETALFLALFSPWLAVGVAQRAQEGLVRAQGARIASQLRLGRPPPGGIEAFGAAAPGRVFVKRLGPTTVEATVALADDPHPEYGPRVVATLEQGRVVALEAFYRGCELKDDALRC